MLVECIWHCGYSGFLLTPAFIQEYANNAICAIPGCLDPVNVGASWLQAFLVQHPSIRSHWSCCLDNARLTGATEKVIRHWFVGLSKVMHDFHVALTNVFNMDKTSFMFGQSASEHMVVPSGDPASPFRVQPGTRESATIIECIGSGGQVLPLLIITKGKRHIVGEQRQMQGIPAMWCFSKSDTSWTNNELAVKWLENVFEPNTRPSLPSEWHLLIIDGHCSHTSEAFCNVLWLHQIIPYLLPAHTMHIMQLLDILIFGPLTAAYCHIVNTAAEHVDTIDKVQFGTFYAQAREKVLTQSAARKAFSDSGNSPSHARLWLSTPCLMPHSMPTLRNLAHRKYRHSSAHFNKQMLRHRLLLWFLKLKSTCFELNMSKRGKQWRWWDGRWQQVIKGCCRRTL
ncbi:related to transposase [Sporisorium reilianum f. sp. reilianum]|uniref:Related to transposase n=1 Tax=Sporisorium reilianum f. sp. reilianum TaxID=72559 RepID=A0A2N8UNG1_9BASI|nr:related to transposase [Sporisorium reilianum f. sp. reilianum]